MGSNKIDPTRVSQEREAGLEVDRIAELEHAARDAVVIIAGLVDGARKYMWYAGTDAGNYLDQVDQAIVRLACVLPENLER